jgi:hypothetical protein
LRPRPSGDYRGGNERERKAAFSPIARILRGVDHAGRQGWLSEVRDLSQGGARLARPQHWQTADDKHYCIYFIFDQETVIAVDASCVRENTEDLGFAFEDGQETKVKDLLYESRFVDQDAP